jgi:hypothetical protein
MLLIRLNGTFQVMNRNSNRRATGEVTHKAVRRGMKTT